MKIPKITQGIRSLLSLLAPLYRATSAGKRFRQQVPTNHRLPKELQKQIITKAAAKRQRKMARHIGWNGG